MISGASVIAAAMPEHLAFGGGDHAPAQALVGRALQVADVRRFPARTAPRVRALWPDSVVPIWGKVGRWYRVPDGYVRQVELQPMQPATEPARTKQPVLPLWGVVSAPVAVVRWWASVAAPPVARIGYGGVMAVVDRLADVPEKTWYAVATGIADEPVGWTQAIRWSLLDDVAASVSGVQLLRLDAGRKTLEAWQGERVRLQVPVAVPATLKTGCWPVTVRKPSITVGEYYGAAWLLEGAGAHLYGAYWHNRFGARIAGEGWEVSPIVARWLYAQLDEDVHLEVIT